MFVHQVYHFVETFLGSLLVSTVAVDVAHHVDGHIHLLVQLLFAQFLRQLQGFLVGLENLLAVHLEHNVVASLGVVPVHVVLLQQVVLQVSQMDVEPGTVAIVKGATHRVAKYLVFRIITIVNVSAAYA